MTHLDAAILGAVQGVLEFVPVSSSTHVRAAGWLLGVDVSPGFNCALNAATIPPVVWCLRGMIGETVRDVRIGVWVVLGCIPAGLLGVLAKTRIEEATSSPWVVTAGFAATAVLLFLATVAARRGGAEVARIGAARALLVGAAQGAALLPGISRSGSTIGTARLLGVAEGAAVRYSFAMSVCLGVGAVAVKAKEIMHGGDDPGVLLVGAGVACGVGFIAAPPLLRFLSTGRLGIFAAWCAVAAAVSYLWA